ncbi:hypothetical protein N7532_011267 [Penicillium argentinense]|uniref:HhH-GPD domain-containing protein n=1 Tax=Penicillium argentinense TaxID=1131581 RepID=A0A9W9EI54_9EURO|nr:uncharacterized protein N7532_011267 [Penicillium argentinense]KAJ5082224.1 hypothetical protein N7532_011267 [Penicillium argentinense]
MTPSDEVKSKFFYNPAGLQNSSFIEQRHPPRAALKILEDKNTPLKFYPSDCPVNDVNSDSDLDGFDLHVPRNDKPPETSLSTPSPNKVTVTTQVKSMPTLLNPETPKSIRRKIPKISPYFPTLPPGPESCLPFPPIDAQYFGLVQEQLAHDPFKLLIATIFLNRTRGGVALPVLFKVFERYPTIDAMASADQSEFVSMIHCLGFQNQRATRCIEIARIWQANPPVREKRYRKLHYPRKLDGRDIERNECIDDEDMRVAWEIAHLPGVGAYSLDSWRIFCRDELRGLAKDWQGTGATMPGFVPEWKSVLPQDKELRAYLTWLWLKEGWIWDHHTGDLEPACDKTQRAAKLGGIAHEDDGNWVLETSPVKVNNGFHAVE